MNKLKNLAKYSHKFSKIPIGIYFEDGSCVLEEHAEDSVLFMDEKWLVKNEEKKIRFWNEKNSLMYASFIKNVDDEKMHIILGPKQIFKSEKEMDFAFSDVVFKVESESFKEWASFVYNLYNLDEECTILDELEYAPENETDTTEGKIGLEKVKSIFSEKDSKPLLIMYIIRFMYSLDSENMSSFVDKFYDSLQLDKKKNRLQALKYNIVTLITTITNEFISNSTLGINEIYSISEVITDEIDMMSDEKKIIQIVKSGLMKYIGIIAGDKEYSTHVHSVLQIINRSIYDKISISEICEQVYLNPSYLSTLFKKEMGISIKSYVQIRKNEEAKFLLKYTDNTVSEISELLNYCSVGYFIKVFKKYTGVTPKEFQQENKIYIH